MSDIELIREIKPEVLNIVGAALSIPQVLADLAMSKTKIAIFLLSNYNDKNDKNMNEFLNEAGLMLACLDDTYNCSQKEDSDVKRISALAANIKSLLEDGVPVYDVKHNYFNNFELLGCQLTKITTHIENFHKNYELNFNIPISIAIKLLSKSDSVMAQLQKVKTQVCH